MYTLPISPVVLRPGYIYLNHLEVQERLSGWWNSAWIFCKSSPGLSSVRLRLGTTAAENLVYQRRLTSTICPALRRPLINVPLLTHTWASCLAFGGLGYGTGVNGGDIGVTGPLHQDTQDSFRLGISIRRSCDSPEQPIHVDLKDAGNPLLTLFPKLIEDAGKLLAEVTVYLYRLGRVVWSMCCVQTWSLFSLLFSPPSFLCSPYNHAT